ncbi:hypothetical protein [uncultured Brachybacterium sp.]|uniref:hypothetical protein n=1 Tax=uncultured Brachybacterium sp. TaxID=189680 RepID=UPI002610F3BC|nr:hypothetical protein [uncultured Brachybacterium sp.]
MNDSHIHAQLHQSGRGALLLKLVELTAESPQHYASHRELAKPFDMSDRDAFYQIGRLRDADLAVPNDRASGGWRPTPEGTRIATGLQSSLEEGQLRLEHTMRAILTNLKDAGGESDRDDWMSWDLHEEGRAPVPLEDREQALDLLKEAEYTTSIDTLQASHLRIEITSRGRAVLTRHDVLLTGGMFEHGQTANFDQRIGIQAQTFHNDGGAVQTGDHAVQNITITNAQVERINESIAAIREVLAREDLDESVRTEVSAAVDELEAAARQQVETGVLHALFTKATMAAASAAGSAAGGALIQSLAAIGTALI